MSEITREKIEASHPDAPWNQADAEFCDKHQDIELERVDGEDEDGKYAFSFCPLCQSLDELNAGDLYCETCIKTDLEFEEGEGFYCLNCEDFTDTGYLGVSPDERLSMPKIDLELSQKALDLINESGFDFHDDTLMRAITESTEDGCFNGSAKDLNRSFRRGLWLSIHNPLKFDVWNEGFIEGSGFSIETLANMYIKARSENNA